jgi:ABC-2 type transport system ATP-binding protein
VEAVCDRAIIINKGRLVADAPIQQLKQQFVGQSVVTVEFAEQTNAQQLSGIKRVKSVERIGERRWKLTSDASQDIRADVFAFAVGNQLTLLELHKEVFSVEDVFQQLTR